MSVYVKKVWHMFLHASLFLGCLLLLLGRIYLWNIYERPASGVHDYERQILGSNQLCYHFELWYIFSDFPLIMFFLTKIVMYCPQLKCRIIKNWLIWKFKFWLFLYFCDELGYVVSIVWNIFRISLFNFPFLLSCAFCICNYLIW